jgi:hypothetical protein
MLIIVFQNLRKGEITSLTIMLTSSKPRHCANNGNWIPASFLSNTYYRRINDKSEKLFCQSLVPLCVSQDK